MSNEVKFNVLDYKLESSTQIPVQGNNTPWSYEVEKLQVELNKVEQGKKFDNGKAPMGLLPAYAKTEIAKVLDFGRIKYGRDNWRAGMDWTRLIDAAYRHLDAFNEGEDIDKESGLPHLAHLGCCVMFLLEFTQTKKEFDNRYKK